jgi:PAS domain S-box-containing protein
MIEGSFDQHPIEPAGGLDARFCEVMDAAPVMIWVSGQDKRCLWFNRQWLIFTGRNMAQELGNGWAEGVHREDFDRCLETYISHFDARKEFRMQYRLRQHDGTYHWIPGFRATPAGAYFLATSDPVLIFTSIELLKTSYGVVCTKLLI